MPEALLNLAKHLTPDASATIRKRGQEYFNKGRVSPLAIRNRKVRATVEGESLYIVQIAAVRARGKAFSLFASCTCPHYASHGEICKHIWATILEIESAEHAILTLGLHEAKEAYLEPADEVDLEPYEDDDDEDEEDEDEEEDELAEIETEPSLPARLPSPFATNPGAATRNANHEPARSPDAAKSTAPTWKSLVNQVAGLDARIRHQRDGAWPADRQIIYLIDPASTRSLGHLTVDILARRRKRDGEWSKPQSKSIRPEATDSLPTAEDRSLIKLMHAGCDAGNMPWRYSGSQSQFTFDPDMQAAIAEALVATGRCFLVPQDDEFSPELEPLQWDEDGPWTFRLSVERRSRGNESFVLRGSLHRGDEQRELAEPDLLTSGKLVFMDNTVAPLDDSGAFPWIALLRQHAEVPVPPGEVDDLLEQLLTMPRLPEIELPPELRVESVPGKPAPRIRMNQPERTPWSRSSGPAREFHADLSFKYDSVIIDPSSAQVGHYQREPRRIIRRDLAAEEDARSRLQRLGFRAPSNAARDNVRDLVIANRNATTAIHTLVAEGWHVEAEGTVYRTSGSLELNMTASGIDWFELDGTASFDDQSVSLPTLLQALGRGEKFIRLGDGSVGMLPEEWINRYAGLAKISQPDSDGRMVMRSTQIGLIDALLDQMPEVNFDQQVARARKKLDRFTKIQPKKPPRGFKGELRPYQRDGLGWMHFLRQLGFGGCLADDMGLGKTVQLLALLEQRRQQRTRGKGRGRKGHDKDQTPPSLVVVPRSLLHNWEAEARRFTPNLRVLNHTGPERFTASSGAPSPSGKDLPEESIVHFADYDMILTTYGTLRRDIAAVQSVHFDYVVLDEAQAIKNAATASAKACRLLRADHRLALSGTPIENHLGELWSLFEFLNPGMLGADSKWIDRLAVQGDGAGESHEQHTESGGAGDTNGEKREVDPALHLLARAVRPFVLRRTKQQVARDLPEKTEQTIFCELKPKQRKLYDELRDHYRASLMAKVESVGLKRSKIMVLEALLRLRQAACHPGLVNREHADAPSAKLDALMPQLSEVVDEGHKALVFSQFTSFLALVRERLDAAGVPYAYLDGRTRNRADRVREFQENPECKLFLISLKAGGLGLNLTAAEYVFLLDPWWNPAVESQAIDRAHRIGQENHVFAYRLIARDTVEEKVLELQQSKRALAESIIRADQNLIRTLTVDDLRALLA